LWLGYVSVLALDLQLPGMLEQAKTYSRAAQDYLEVHAPWLAPTTAPADQLREAGGEQLRAYLASITGHAAYILIEALEVIFLPHLPPLGGPQPAAAYPARLRP